MRSAAVRISSCSHTLITVHPALISLQSVSRSRAIFAVIFARHHSAFLFGQVPCSGQPCQKHPSMNTAVLEAGKVISTERRLLINTRRCRRNRNPRWCSSDRRARSLGLSRCAVLDIRWTVSGDGGARKLILFDFFGMMCEIGTERLLVAQLALDEPREKTGSRFMRQRNDLVFEERGQMLIRHRNRPF